MLPTPPTSRPTGARRRVTELSQELGFIHKFVPGTSSLTVLALHGTGGDESDLLPLVAELVPEANVLSPRGKVLEQGMPRFFRRLALGVFDEDDLRARANELAHFLVAAADRYAFDPDQVAIAGYSNGANIGAALLFLHPRAVAGACLLHVMVPFQNERPPPLNGLPVLITAGRTDPLIPPDQSQRLADLLIEAGADVELAWQERGHGLTLPEVAQALAWFEGLKESS
jgi:phospholipase/carboxylesterase